MHISAHSAAYYRVNTHDSVCVPSCVCKCQQRWVKNVFLFFQFSNLSTMIWFHCRERTGQLLIRSFKHRTSVWLVVPSVHLIPVPVTQDEHGETCAVVIKAQAAEPKGQRSGSRTVLTANVLACHTNDGCVRLNRSTPSTMDWWVERWMEQWIDGWMDGRSDGWMNGWITEATKWKRATVRPSFPFIRPELFGVKCMSAARRRPGAKIHLSWDYTHR